VHQVTAKTQQRRVPNVTFTLTGSMNAGDIRYGINSNVGHVVLQIIWKMNVNLVGMTGDNPEALEILEHKHL